MPQTMLESVKSLWAIIPPDDLISKISAVLLGVSALIAQPAPSLAQSSVFGDLNPAPSRETSREALQNTSSNRAWPVDSKEKKILLGKIEDYFEEVGTLKARFHQYNMDGSLLHGDFFLKRPGKMRIDYDAPTPYQIISDGSFYIFVDEALEEASYIPLYLTPAHMMLKQPLNLGEDLIVTEAVRTSDRFAVTVVQKENRNAGSLSLVFSQDPLTLRQWIVVDAQGLTTKVTLQTLKTGMPLSPDLFYFNNPWQEREDGN